MWVITLASEVLGVKDRVFVFNTLAEAEEFASCVYGRYDVESEFVRAGEPTEVLENWSF